VRIPQRAFCFSRLHAGRLRAEGLRGEVTVLEGEYAGRAEPQVEGYVDPGPVVFAGRHIPEKRVPALIAALARLPDLRAEIYGDGPERERVLSLIRSHDLEGRVSAPGFVPHEQVDAALRSALCLVLPSRREGYGLVVIEACAAGTPAVVVADPDNAAVELIEAGVNGFVAPSASPEYLAAAIVRVREGGAALRASTAEWYRANARRLSLEDSLERVAEAYRA
jgi:glycosyltransferase involved in cell wall biosynthesis